MPEKSITSVNLSVDVLRKLRALRESQGMTISQICELALLQYFEAGTDNDRTAIDKTLQVLMREIDGLRQTYVDGTPRDGFGLVKVLEKTLEGLHKYSARPSHQLLAKLTGDLESALDRATSVRSNSKKASAKGGGK